MGNQKPVRGIVVAPTNLDNNANSMQIALVNTDGTTASTIKKQAAQADTVAADLAALKVDFNALLAKLRLAGVIS